MDLKFRVQAAHWQPRGGDDRREPPLSVGDLLGTSSSWGRAGVPSPSLGTHASFPAAGFSAGRRHSRNL